MNWDALGAIAELLGAVGVIGSLLYLAGQVRMSSRASAVESKLESTALLCNFIDSIIGDPDLLDLQRRGIADVELLTKPEYIRFSNMSMKAFWMFSASYFQYRSGTITEDDFHETKAVIHYWLRGRGCRMWWGKFGRESMSPLFAKFIDAEIEKIKPLIEKPRPVSSPTVAT